MSDVECAICRAPARDQGSDYYSCCPICATALHKEADPTSPYGTKGDGFPKWDLAFWVPLFEKVKAQLTQTPIVMVNFLDKKCKLCGIKNDLGAKKCYYCETLGPTDY
jgi:hypothetical protein